MLNVKLVFIMGTIYKITNLLNNKIYVGQTIQKVKRRWKSHCCVNKANAKMPIVRAIKKYGKVNFLFEVLELNVPQNDLSSKEAYYVKLFNSNHSEFGYNVGDIVDGRIVATEACRKIMSDTMKRTHETLKMKAITKANGLKRRGKKIGGTSRHVGVSLNKVGNSVYWRATSSFEGKAYNLGSFKTEDEAALAYNKFALEHFGEEATLNCVN